VRLTPIVRISLGLVVLTSCILLIGDLAGLGPGRSDAPLVARKKLCETLAVQFAMHAERGEWGRVRTAMDLLRRRDAEVLSVALRSADGRVLVHSGDHAAHWTPPPEGRSTATHAQVPILRGDRAWGALEVAFTPLAPGGLRGLWQTPLGRLLLFVGLLGFVAYVVFLRRTLRHLDPSAVIPPRVQAVLDTLGEGVMLLDPDERIVLANRALAERLGREPARLLGVRPSGLDWRSPAGSRLPRRELPWTPALAGRGARSGVSLRMETPDGVERTFLVNSAPIAEDGGRVRGVLATFDDVTDLERKSVELERALEELEKSRDEIRLQNDELKVLATRDPLTGALNRRAFLEAMEGALDARADGVHVVMLDIDHFKQVNDRFGHHVGDRVIGTVASTVGALLREDERICRWGGEEFCLLLRGRTREEAEALAETARLRVAGIDASGLGMGADERLSASFGVHHVGPRGGEPLRLIERADGALYEAKQAGRNRVRIDRGATAA
jgi:diguanylate cyclase (GGDEF)-like protein/PAS domain S-box-containing protein